MWSDPENCRKVHKARKYTKRRRQDQRQLYIRTGNLDSNTKTSK